MGARWNMGEGRGAAAQERERADLGPANGLERKMPLVPTEEWTVAPERSLGWIRVGPGQSEVRVR